MSSETRLFVGNLPTDSSVDELSREFSTFGLVTKIDLKSKNDESGAKKFAFVTLSTTNYDVESCIKHFTNEDYNGSRLYVTRARESFLERLQRERDQAADKEKSKQNEATNVPEDSNLSKNPIIKLGDKLTPGKRKIDNYANELPPKETLSKKKFIKTPILNGIPEHSESKYERKLKVNSFEGDKKKKDADQKRLESIKRKRQEFKQKQMIIKTGLIGVDAPNKKVIFSDDEAGSSKAKDNHRETVTNSPPNKKRKELFDEEDSDDEVNFEIKEQFEGKKGKQILDLQSRYKPDKRFVLDKRFIEDDTQENEANDDRVDKEDEQIDGTQEDEKYKQLNILQDVLGVAIKTRREPDSDNKKTKSKLGMLRFDPLQPDHAKYLAPVAETKKESKKQKKAKKDNLKVEEPPKEIIPEPPKVEVSKEQFYKVSETLKEAIAQPSSFSLRSMFGKADDEERNENPEADKEEETYIPLEKPKQPKVKNPLDPGERNPFVYDSSDSDDEPENVNKKQDVKVDEKVTDTTETKAVWKENLFFTKDDHRLKEALIFFNKASDGHKERRELKSLMKKRIYNKERKNQMFQKKLGGKRKTVKKPYKKKH